MQMAKRHEAVSSLSKLIYHVISLFLVLCHRTYSSSMWAIGDSTAK